MWSLELGDRLGDLVTGGGVSARIEPLRTASDKKAEAGDGALISHPAVISRGRRRLLERQIVASIDSFDELSFGAITADPLEPGSKVIVSFLAPRSLTAAHEGIRCRFAAVVVSSRANASKGARFALRLEWERPLSQMVAKAVVTRNIRLGVALFSLLGGAAWYTSGRYDDFWLSPVWNLYAITIGAYFYSRFILTLFHSPPKTKTTNFQPTMSIVISARNEENGIVNCVDSCYEAYYPKEKREVIVVDDGSTDGTPQVIARLKAKYPELRAYALPPSGKRFAMAKGIREATGEIVVVLDSDTTLEPDALRQIVTGFDDPTLGGVSGYTSVANAETNLLTRMQDVRYLVSYELMKAPESLFDSVTCCPGCLSAYRREYLLGILEPWLNQTFLGARATFGDDRSLTNYILRDYRVIYNPLARSSTIVPENWMHYMRQQCRWKKSWLREAPIAGRILLKKHPAAALSFYASALCSFTSPIVVVYYLARSPDLSAYFGWMLLLGLLMITFATWRRPTKHWYVTWVWLLSQVFLMAPQTYYALLTMRKNHWGTR